MNKKVFFIFGVLLSTNLHSFVTKAHVLASSRCSLLVSADESVRGDHASKQEESAMTVVDRSASIVPVYFEMPFFVRNKKISGISFSLPKDAWANKKKIQKEALLTYGHDFSDGTWIFYYDEQGNRCVSVRRQLPYRFDLSNRELFKLFKK